MRVQEMSYYEQALKHRSTLRGVVDSHRFSNERLEFLGDAVLGFVTAAYLYHHFPDKDEGFLTRLRAKLVNGPALARCARHLNLGALVLMSTNMARGEGRSNKTILADAYEALIGALYLDLGPEAARTFIHDSMLNRINLEELSEQRDNYKSLLLEYAQARGWSQPRYRVRLEEGPSHERQFTVDVMVNNESYGHGTALSKKLAEQRAADYALQRLATLESAEPEQNEADD